MCRVPFLGNGHTLAVQSSRAAPGAQGCAAPRAVTPLIYLSVLLQLQTCPALATSHFPYFSWEIMPQPISSCGKKSLLSFRPNMPFLYFIPLLWVISDLLHSFCLSAQQLLHSWTCALLPFPAWLASQLGVLFNAKLHFLYFFMWTFLICDFLPRTPLFSKNTW